MVRAAVGLRVKSGWAMSVLVAGDTGTPRVVACRRVELADPLVPESVQPYHAALDLAGDRARRTVAKLVQVVERTSQRSLAQLLEEYRRGGHELVGAGIVVGSTIDPATIGNDHIRAHAEEGRLFRRVLESGVREHGIATRVMLEQQALAQASAALQRGERELRSALAALGKGVSDRWRAEEKLATLAAWLML
ncbi:MAG: hypothetical protein U1E76_03630 [Planctomycetota bacterium]